MPILCWSRGQIELNLVEMLMIHVAARGKLQRPWNTGSSPATSLALTLHECSAVPAYRRASSLGVVRRVSRQRIRRPCRSVAASSAPVDRGLHEGQKLTAPTL